MTSGKKSILVTSSGAIDRPLTGRHAIDTLLQAHTTNRVRPPVRLCLFYIIPDKILITLTSKNRITYTPIFNKSTLNIWE